MSKDTNSAVLLDKILFSHQEIIDVIKKYADFLNKKYHNKELVIITILNGGFLFASYLIHYLKLNIVVDFIAISTYYKNQPKKNIHFYKRLKIDITNKNVLILDDVVDTGTTIHLLYNFLKTLHPLDIQFTSLVVRQKTFAKQKFVLPVKGLLFLSYNYWIVGFGIDYQEKFRQLKDIHCLKWSKNKKLILTK